MFDDTPTARPGHSYFFSQRTCGHSSDPFVPHIERLRMAMRAARARHPFEIDEIVVLPGVIHAIWTLPQGDHDHDIRWRMVKASFSRALGMAGARPVTWQRSRWSHAIRDHDDMVLHRALIHAAPVVAGLAARPEAWPYSSIHRARESAGHRARACGRGAAIPAPTRPHAQAAPALTSHSPGDQ